MPFAAPRASAAVVLAVALALACGACSTAPPPAAETTSTVTASGPTGPTGAVTSTDAGHGLPPFATYARLGSAADIDRRAGTETSGIATSGVDADVVFTVDDATGADRLGVVRVDGGYVGTVVVRGMSAANAEALAAGPCARGSARRCLYVGDIGDHVGRDSVTVYRLAEPDPRRLPTAPVDAARWTYRYPDGRYDAEGLGIVADGGVVVVTKRPVGSSDDGTARIYRGPAGGGRLTFVTALRLPRPPAPAQSLLVGNLVTDAYFGPGRVVLLTYDQLVEYVAPSLASDLSRFAAWPSRSTAVRGVLQAEGLSLSGTPGSAGCAYVVAGEGRNGGRAQIARGGC